jgi:hypothetical protein
MLELTKRREDSLKAAQTERKTTEMYLNRRPRGADDQRVLALVDRDLDSPHVVGGRGVVATAKTRSSRPLNGMGANVERSRNGVVLWIVDLEVN